MNLIQLKPRKALNKAFLKVKAKTFILPYFYFSKLVYQLYGLSAEEIKIVEGKV